MNKSDNTIKKPSFQVRAHRFMARRFARELMRSTLKNEECVYNPSLFSLLATAAGIGTYTSVAAIFSLGGAVFDPHLAEKAQLWAVAAGTGLLSARALVFQDNVKYAIKPSQHPILEPDSAPIATALSICLHGILFADQSLIGEYRNLAEQEELQEQADQPLGKPEIMLRAKFENSIDINLTKFDSVLEEIPSANRTAILKQIDDAGQLAQELRHQAIANMAGPYKVDDTLRDNMVAAATQLGFKKEFEDYLGKVYERRSKSLVRAAASSPAP